MCTPEAKLGPYLAVTGNIMLTGVRTDTYLGFKTKLEAGNSYVGLLKSSE